MADFIDDGNCFVCGEKNPLGLRIQFRAGAGGSGVEAAVVFPGHLQGWQDVVHGGLITTVLDETLIKAAAAAGLACVTGEITVKFLAPARTGAAYIAGGRVLEERGRLVLAESELQAGDGTIIARASGKLVKAAADIRKQT